MSVHDEEHHADRGYSQNTRANRAKVNHRDTRLRHLTTTRQKRNHRTSFYRELRRDASKYSRPFEIARVLVRFNQIEDVRKMQAFAAPKKVGKSIALWIKRLTKA